MGSGDGNFSIGCQQEVGGGQVGIFKYILPLRNVFKAAETVYRPVKIPSVAPNHTMLSPPAVVSDSSFFTPVSSSIAPPSAGVTGTKSTLMSMLSGGSSKESSTAGGLLKSLLAAPAVVPQVSDIPSLPVNSPATIEKKEKKPKIPAITAVPPMQSPVPLSPVTIPQDSSPAAVTSALPTSSSEQQKFLKETLRDQAKAITKTVKEDIKLQEVSITASIREELKKVSQAEVLQSLEKKLPNLIASEVKGQLKAHIEATFKKSFETSLLPAFQAGTNKMFSQIQKAFDRYSIY
jgi:hypothetical protein